MRFIFSTPRLFQIIFLSWLVAVLSTLAYSVQAQVKCKTSSSPTACEDKCTSQDGLYEATLENGTYVVREKKSGKTILTTKGKFSQANDVKAGAFVCDKDKSALTFRALYHYGHKGPCTWAGVWNVATGTQIGAYEKEGYNRNATENYSEGVTCAP